MGTATLTTSDDFWVTNVSFGTFEVTGTFIGIFWITDVSIDTLRLTVILLARSWFVLCLKAKALTCDPILLSKWATDLGQKELGPHPH